MSNIYWNCTDYHCVHTDINTIDYHLRSGDKYFKCELRTDMYVL